MTIATGRRIATCQVSAGDDRSGIAAPGWPRAIRPEDRTPHVSVSGNRPAGEGRRPAAIDRISPAGRRTPTARSALKYAPTLWECQRVVPSCSVRLPQRIRASTPTPCPGPDQRVSSLTPNNGGGNAVGVQCRRRPGAAVGVEGQFIQFGSPTSPGCLGGGVAKGPGVRDRLIRPEDRATGHFNHVCCYRACCCPEPNNSRVRWIAWLRSATGQGVEPERDSNDGRR